MGRRPVGGFLGALVSAAFVIGLTLATAGAAGAQEGEWVPLRSPRGTDQARVTFYGARYDDGRHYCASGRLYAGDGWFVALGPSMLRRARELAGMEWPTVRLVVGGQAFVLPVADGGAAAYGYELEVDLPDLTWQRISGLPLSAGIFLAQVEVLAGRPPAPIWSYYFPRLDSVYGNRSVRVVPRIECSGYECEPVDSWNVGNSLRALPAEVRCQAATQ